MGTALVPLSALAAEIIQRLRLADKADDHRISAGKLLIEAQQRIEKGEAGEVTWGEWCFQNIHDRTLRDIQRCMKLAGAADPVAARETEKAINRAAKPVGSRATGASRKDSSVDLSDPVIRLSAAVASLSIEDFERFKTWFLAYMGR